MQGSQKRLPILFCQVAVLWLLKLRVARNNSRDDLFRTFLSGKGHSALQETLSDELITPTHSGPT
jgi:hypothetical protein